MILFLMCRLSPGIEELVQKLKANGIDVYLVSGGFRQMIIVRRIVEINGFSDPLCVWKEMNSFYGML